MTDEMIVALAKKGGVIQINFSCDFLNPDVLKAEEAIAPKLTALRDELIKKYAAEPDSIARAMREAYQQAGGGNIPRATLADVVKHIDHAVQVGGIDSSASVATSMASAAPPPISTASISGPISRARCWKKAIPPPKSARSTAKIPCV